MNAINYMIQGFPMFEATVLKWTAAGKGEAK
jgi:hypothetical protein